MLMSMQSVEKIYRPYCFPFSCFYELILRFFLMLFINAISFYSMVLTCSCKILMFLVFHLFLYDCNFAFFSFALISDICKYVL